MRNPKRPLTFVILGYARDFAASSAPLRRPVARLRTSEGVTESIHDLIALACKLKTSTASKLEMRNGLELLTTLVHIRFAFRYSHLAFLLSSPPETPGGWMALPTKTDVR